MDEDKTAVQQVATTTTAPSAVITAVKPGWKTSEGIGFGIMLVMAAADSVQHFMQKNEGATPWAIIGAAIYGVAYAYCRAKVKTAGQPASGGTT